MTYRALEQEWELGSRTRFKLADDTKCASYLTKYLVKEASTRIRASSYYGSEPPACAEDRIALQSALSGALGEIGDVDAKLQLSSSLPVPQKEER
jgi:hypothetical protein